MKNMDHHIMDDVINVKQASLTLLSDIASQKLNNLLVPNLRKKKNNEWRTYETTKRPDKRP